MEEGRKRRCGRGKEMGMERRETDGFEWVRDLRRRPTERKGQLLVRLHGNRLRASLLVEVRVAIGLGWRC